MNRWHTIFFDLDGTLTDSLPDIADVCNEVIAEAGYPRRTLAEYREFVGWGLKRTMQKALPETIAAQELEILFQSMKSRYIANPVRHTDAYPGIPEALSVLRSRKIRMGVLTNKEEATACRVVETLFPAGTFDVVLGACDGRPLKPDPFALTQWMAQEACDPSGVLMVGDTPVDARTAFRAGIAFRGVSWGYRSVAELEHAGCQYILNHPEELVSLEQVG